MNHRSFHVAAGMAGKVELMDIVLCESIEEI